MPASEDYYKILGIARDASPADIQKAYRGLARKYHPDLNPDDKKAKEKFQEVQKAFDVLNDPSKRELYDRYGSSFESMGSGPGPRPGGYSAGGPGTAGFEDFDFSQFFGERFGSDPSGGFGDIFSQFRRAQGGGRGGRRNRTAPVSGQDIHSEVEIPFQTAVTGGQVELSISRGTGKNDTLTVKIPAGVEDGKRIRLRGQGQPGPQPGDLLLTVKVLPHPHFQRRGNHLDVKLPVTLAEAVLGAKVDVPTPLGTISLRVPPGTSSGTKLRAKGRGVVPAKGEPGDLYAEVQIVLPDKLDDEVLAAIQKVGEQSTGNPRADLRW